MKLAIRYIMYGGISFSLIWIIIFIKSNQLLDQSSSRSILPRHVSLRHRDSVGTTNNALSLNELKYDDTVEMIAVNIAKGQRDTTDLISLSIVRDSDEEARKIDGFRQHAFNQLISDRLSLFRDVPDTRNHKCKEAKYPATLPTVSIVVCFYNEAWSTLLRTVYSVINRTPPHLLYEILLIDDHSDPSLGHLGKPLDDYVALHFRKVKVFHLEVRMGLMAARNYGARQAHGQVLVFLDSHCEVNTHWLPPLLARVSHDAQIVAIPLIDIIQEDTLQYVAAPLVRGGFSWTLNFRWDSFPDAVKHAPHTQPVETPTMAGGLYAIDRDYFFTMGAYDDGMSIWGGENLEMSFRIWQCGGRLEILPCSRVGHIFRNRRPYGPDLIPERNSLRVAHVWMDGFKEVYLKNAPSASHTEYGDVSARLALRQSLVCKSFTWYLDNVYPEQDQTGSSLAMHPQKKSVKVLRKSAIQHVSSGLCMESVKEVHDKKSLIRLSPCSPANRKQLWHQTASGELKLAGLLCLDFSDNDRRGLVVPMLQKCHGSQQSQQWLTVRMDTAFRVFNPASGKCVSISPVDHTQYVSMAICTQSSQLLFQFHDS